MVTRWLFEDLETVESYQLEINPGEMTLPAYEKSMTYNNTTASGEEGRVVAFEGADKPLFLSFTGVSLSSAQDEAFKTWYRKRHQIRITDDRGDQWIVYITKYAPKRKRSVHYPYRHDYSIEAFVLDWP